MARTEGGLIFVLDTNSGSMPALLRSSRVLDHDRLRTLEDLGIRPDASDSDLLARLGQVGGSVLVTRDGRMLEPQLQRQAWRDAGVILFLLGKRWGGLPIREITRRMLFLWPQIVEYAEESAPGQAWRVSPSIPNPSTNAFRLVTGRHADPGQA